MFIQDHHRQNYQRPLQDLLLAATDGESMPYEDFNEAIKKAGQETSMLVRSKGGDWFIFNQDPPPD